VQYNEQSESFVIDRDFSPQTLRNRFDIASSNNLILTDSDGYDVIIDSTLRSGAYVLYSKSSSLSFTRSASSSVSSSSSSLLPSSSSIRSVSQTDQSSNRSVVSSPSVVSSSSSLSSLLVSPAISTSSLSGADSKVINEIKNKLAITELIDKFSHTADNSDWKQCDNLFADQIDVDFQSVSGHPPQNLTKDEILKLWQSNATLFDATQHLITNHVIVLNENTAEVTSQVQTTQYLTVGYDKDDWINRGLHGQEYQVHIGRFNFGLSLNNNQWRFNKIKLVILFRYGNKDLIEIAKRRAQKKIEGTK